MDELGQQALADEFDGGCGGTDREICRRFRHSASQLHSRSVEVHESYADISASAGRGSG